MTEARKIDIFSTESITVYENFESREQAEARRAEVLSSILASDNEDLTRIEQHEPYGVTLRYFSPNIENVRNLSDKHALSIEAMKHAILRKRKIQQAAEPETIEVLKQIIPFVEYLADAGNKHAEEMFKLATAAIAKAEAGR